MIRYTRHIVLLAVLAVSAAGRAQTAPPGDTANPGTPEVAAPPAADQVPGPPTQTPAAPAVDAARLDEIEQLARISARKHELLEEEAAKRAKEAPKLVVDDTGFGLTTPDKAYLVRIRGLLQADGRFFAKSDTLQANDTFLIRRFRPAIDGTLFSLVDFRLTPEFAGSAVTILDAYMDLHPRAWLRLRVGKMKVPIGLERLQSDADLPILERALDQNLTSQRDVGAQLWGDVAGGIVQYAAGIFNGDADTTAADTDLNHAKDIVGRLLLQPFKAEGLRGLGNLGVGFSVQSGNRKGRLPTAVTGLPIPSAAAQTGLAPFRTSGQNTFFQYLAPSTDTTGATTVFAHERATHLNPQLFYYYGPVGVLAEYVWLKQGVQKGNTVADLTQKSAHATVSFSIGGTEGYDGSTPEDPFDLAHGHLGALQLAVRYGWIGIDDATFPTFANPVASARSAQQIAGGLAWVPRRSFHLAINYEQTRFKGGAGTAASGMNPAVINDRATEHLILGRAQVNF